MSPTILSLLLNATVATIYMVFAASLIASLFGIPLGVLLYVTRKAHILENLRLNQALSILINITRSIPFIILMIAIIPFTRWIVGTSIGTNAAIVPLSLSAIPFIARVVEGALLETPHGLIEAALSMGASPFQIIYKVLIPESLPGIVNGMTLTIVSLVGYSAMAGAVGGGGLGDVAIRYGLQRFDISTMFITIAIMIFLVQVIQLSGDFISKRLAHFKH
jgi:D-methionine transport system permease protein